MSTHCHHPARILPSICLLIMGATCASPPAQKIQHDDRDNYLKPHVKAGAVLSDITYRVISLQTPGYDDSVYQIPATGTFTFAEDATPDVISWRVSARYDGKPSIKDEAGEFR